MEIVEVRYGLRWEHHYVEATVASDDSNDTPDPTQAVQKMYIYAQEVVREQVRKLKAQQVSPQEPSLPPKTPQPPTMQQVAHPIRNRLSDPTKKQIGYIEGLARRLGRKVDVSDIRTVAAASEVITELMAEVERQKDRTDKDTNR